MDVTTDQTCTRRKRDASWQRSREEAPDLCVLAPAVRVPSLFVDDRRARTNLLIY